MNGAIFFSTKYGSTAEYAKWIGEATGLPVFNVKDGNADPSKYDFLVLGSPVIYMRLTIGKWVRKHEQVIAQKPVIFFTVSGAPAGKKLDGWVANSLPAGLVPKMDHVALRGRQIRADLSLFDKVMLKIASMANSNAKASKEEGEGFDFMDKSSIAPIVDLVSKF